MHHIQAAIPLPVGHGWEGSNLGRGSFGGGILLRGIGWAHLQEERADLRPVLFRKNGQVPASKRQQHPRRSRARRTSNAVSKPRAQHVRQGGGRRNDVGASNRLVGNRATQAGIDLIAGGPGSGGGFHHVTDTYTEQQLADRAATYNPAALPYCSSIYLQH